MTLPNTLNISTKGIVGNDLLARTPEVMQVPQTINGTICYGTPKEQVLGTLRLSLGRWSTKEEIDDASKLIVQNTQLEC